MNKYVKSGLTHTSVSIGLYLISWSIAIFSFVIAGITAAIWVLGHYGADTTNNHVLKKLKQEQTDHEAKKSLTGLYGMVVNIKTKFSAGLDKLHPGYKYVLVAEIILDLIVCFQTIAKESQTNIDIVIYSNVAITAFFAIYAFTMGVRNPKSEQADLHFKSPESQDSEAA